MDTTSNSCPWCSTTIPAGAAACPQCGAAIEGVVSSDIPGVTSVDGGASLGPDEGQIPDGIDPSAWLMAGRGGEEVDRDAVALPSDQVKAEMLRIELEAELANAGSATLGAADDEARLARRPSAEALEALREGLISLPEAEVEQLEDRVEGLKVDEDLDR